ncbi:DUF2125 domain-containing protein [Sulfitobacter sabulilitoris]|uniref:DUF2125 domain-containing protein n=1 Tax=Sulfitobacter sabulilitoris TaxID=2562655 RepID=A0A5S3PM72_9RHOB|nr:DUF2125 domain-containing protein [Sulfitobacter sabulilitoris]TMM55483.1 DUF2125 domain-containing protein [Sulfitobacter sabulilitoris]
MRRVILGMVLLAAVWSAWWGVAAGGLHQGLTRWFDARRAEGWQADVASLPMHGYPFTLGVTLVRPVLADPATGVAIEASGLTIRAPAYWPGYVTLEVPDDPILLASPQGRASLTLQDGRADLRLHPGTALALDSMAVTTGAWSLDAHGDGSVMSAQTLTLAMTETDGPEAAYRFDIVAEGFRPGDLPRARLRVPRDWPLRFDSLKARMDATFDRRWDRRAIEDARPQPRSLDLNLLEAVWGDLRIKAAGTLTIDAEGVPDGTVSVQAENWRDLLDLADAAGLLPGPVRSQVERALGTLAGLTGNPDTLDVQLNVRNGFVAAGFLPLGPAPRLILR